VDLIKDGATNFCIVADRGVIYKVRPQDTGFMAIQLGFEHGTAGMLNAFIEQYDEEDGILGNLKPAEFVDRKPADYPGWTVVLSKTPGAEPGRVRIDRRRGNSASKVPRRAKCVAPWSYCCG